MNTVTLRPRGLPALDIPVREIVKLYGQGKTCRQIVARFTSLPENYYINLQTALKKIGLSNPGREPLQHELCYTPRIGPQVFVNKKRFYDEFNRLKDANIVRGADKNLSLAMGIGLDAVKSIRVSQGLRFCTRNTDKGASIGIAHDAPELPVIKENRSCLFGTSSACHGAAYMSTGRGDRCCPPCRKNKL